MDIRFAETPRKVPLKDSTSELGQVVTSVHTWAREIALTIRNLNDQLSKLQTAVDKKVASTPTTSTTKETTQTVQIDTTFSGRYPDLRDKPTTLAQAGITDAQPKDDDLLAIAELVTQAFGRSLLTLDSLSAAQALLGTNREPMTNGDPVNPEIYFDITGDCVMSTPSP